MSDTRRFYHRSILAAAGSGKTYRLTSRFRELAAAGATWATMNKMRQR